jgi:hypothetical protein
MAGDAIVGTGGPSVSADKLKRISIMEKRDIFSELVEGIDALKAEREGKLTLRQVKVGPNATTRKAMKVLEAGRGKKFSTVDALMTDLNAAD